MKLMGISSSGSTKFVGADAQQLKEWINMLMEEQEVYFSKKVGKALERSGRRM